MKTKNLLLALFVFMASVSLAQLISVTDGMSNGNTPDGNEYGYESGSAVYRNVAQSFTAGGAWDITSIDLFIKEYSGDNTTVWVELWDDNSGSPGTVIASGVSSSVSMAGVSSYTWTNFAFPSSPSLTSSSVYWIVVRSSLDNDWYYVGFDSNNPITGNMMQVSSGVWSNVDGDANIDMLFELNGSVAGPMSFVSCTASQPNTANVTPNTVDQEVLKIEVVTTGSTSPLDATQFRIRTNGTSDYANDIQNAKIWYTGTSDVFATSNQFGSTFVAPNAPGSNSNISGTQTLASGTNYFWLTYDVTPGANIGNVIDARLHRVKVDGTQRVPTTAEPAGSRLIDYCAFSNTSSTTYYIDDFSTTNGTTNISNTASGFSTNGYGDFTVQTVTQEQGGTVDYSASFGSSGSYTFGLSIWIDWNEDGDFDDADEEVYVSSSYASTYSGTITVPTSATTGNKRMRILADYSDSTPNDPCASADEAEDYTFVVTAGTNMSVSSIVTTQTNTADVYAGVAEKEMIGVEITTTGFVSPISASSFTFSTNGSTSAATDIQNAKLWTTGSSSTFAMTTQLGSVVAAPNGTYTFTSGTNLPYELANGTNYFWITYDIPSSATVGNVIDAECSSVTVDGSPITPSITAPAGNREIITPPVFDGTFESGVDFAGNGMTEVDDTPNYWVVGTATNNGGSRSAYVTNDGSSNTYDITTTSYSHFYFDYLFPAGETIITLTFDWKCDGESSYDNIKVFVQPITEVPVAGTANSGTYQEGSSYYSESTTWQTETITLDASFAGTLQKVVFQWKNDGSVGDDPPAAIDNIIIDTHAPSPPPCAENLSPADACSDLCNATVDLSWDDPSTGDGHDGFYLYFGTDNPPTNIVNGTNLGDVNTYDPGTLTGNTTYYWQIVPFNAGGDASGCSVYSFSTGAGQANDLPCNAEAITLGATASGDNECTSDDDDPSVPGCWTSGTVNSVWYSFVAPASGSVDIVTGLGTLQSTQVAVYSGTCSSLVYEDCNQDAPSCGYSYDNSNFTVTGLSSGDTYYVMVDGEYDETGTFNITIADNAIGLPIVFGQDCGIDNAIPVCNSQFVVGDPGFQAVGNYCDFDGSVDCTSGERGAVWYHIEIGVSGVLDFTLVPNDWDGSDYSETDYDFLLYRVASPSVDSLVVTCEEIQDGTGLPIRCNYSADGITGMYSSTAGVQPPAYSSVYSDAFEAELDVLAGDEFFLVIQNYSNSDYGFDMDLGASPITVPGGVPTSLTWTGGANSTDWYEPLNWGDCSYYPSETIDANIIASSAYLPVIDDVDPNDASNARVKSLTINTGANLKINANQILEIYGDYDNTGILDANTTATIMCKGNANQTFDGSLQGASAFPNLKLAKTGGSLVVNQDVEINTDFVTSDINSVFDLNDKMFTVGGDFNNFQGSSTFTNTSASTFVFNGSAAQDYQPGASLILNDVKIQNTGAGVDLQSDLNIGSSGSLELTDGLINTSTNQVIVQNTSGSAITVGSKQSYINGQLRAYIANNSDTYNLPVGDANQYALARIGNHNLAGVAYLDVEFFDTFTNTGSLDPARAEDLGSAYVSVCTEGLWEIVPNSTPSSGTYDIFLTFDDGLGYDGLGIPLGNAFSGIEDNLFGVLKRDHNSNLASEWYGSPVGSINANDGVGRMRSDGYASRYGIASFSDFAIALADFPLPIDLLSFKLDCTAEGIKVAWEVGAELNVAQYRIERSYDAVNYKTASFIEPSFGYSSLKEYQWVDKHAKASTVYYRLIEEDFDEKIVEFMPKAISCKDEQSNYLISYQEKNSFRVFVKTMIPEGEYQLSIIDNLGRIVHTSDYNQTVETHRVLLQNQRLNKGVYIVKVENSYFNISQKLVIE